MGSECNHQRQLTIPKIKNVDNVIRNNDDDGIEIRLQSYNGPLVRLHHSEQ